MMSCYMRKSAEYNARLPMSVQAPDYPASTAARQNAQPEPRETNQLARNMLGPGYRRHWWRGSDAFKDKMKAAGKAPWWVKPLLGADKALDRVGLNPLPLEHLTYEQIRRARAATLERQRGLHTAEGDKPIPIEAVEHFGGVGATR